MQQVLSELQYIERPMSSAWTPHYLSTFSYKYDRVKNPLVYLPTLLIFLTTCAQPDKRQTIKNEEGIQLASLPDAGIDSVVINSVDTAIRHGTYPNIHSLLIARHNKLVYEKYWPGRDEAWGYDHGITIHGRDSLHDIRSISKSIVSTSM